MIRFIASVFVLIVLVNATTAPDSKPLAGGQTAPDFTLVDHHGKKVTLSESKGKSPVVLVFYRGYW